MRKTDVQLQIGAAQGGPVADPLDLEPARSSPRSVGRLTTSVPSSCSTCILAGTVWLSSPNGPFT
jgi:hypothetical protein